MKKIPQTPPWSDVRVPDLTFDLCDLVSYSSDMGKRNLNTHHISSDPSEGFQCLGEDCLFIMVLSKQESYSFGGHLITKAQQKNDVRLIIV